MMKKIIKGLVGFGLGIMVFSLPAMAVHAEEDQILNGIYVDDLSLGGMTKQEAEKALEDYTDALAGKTITLIAAENHEVPVTLSELGFDWSNREIIEEAAKIGQDGNVIKRYKAAKDLEHQNVVYHMEFSLDQDLTQAILSERCSVYDVAAQDASLSRENGQFVVIPGQTGQVVDLAASETELLNYLNGSWGKEDSQFPLTVIVDEARGTAEELSKVKDVLGTFSTSFKTSSAARCANVRNGCELINGTILYPGDEFSTYVAVSPFTEANGYYLAGSYLNGQVVDSFGGGICQDSTTLYNAVLLAELEVTERHNHSMIVSYVDPSADAAIAESAGKDFRFVNNTQAPIYIEGYTTEDKQVCFTIYGMETRSSDRQVRYESEIISRTVPDTEVIYTNEGLPVGSVAVQSAHIGYKANLWKIVTEGGVEVSREMVNSSSYKMVPRTATVGVATQDPNAYNEIMAAVGTGNIDHVKGVAAALAGGTEIPQAPAAPEAEAAPPAEGQPAQPAAEEGQ